MIKIIGAKRLLILGILLLINGALAGVLFGWVEPLREEAESKKTSVEREISDMQRAIVNIKQTLAALEVNQVHYETLVDRGFYMEQDRFLVGKKLEELRKSARISFLEFDVDAIAEISNNEAKGMGYRLIHSRVKVDNITAFLDTDVYKFIRFINTHFPGHTRVHSLEIERDNLYSDAVLQDISAGQPKGLVKASLVFDWLTLLPIQTDGPSGADPFRRR